IASRAQGLGADPQRSVVVVQIHLTTIGEIRDIWPIHEVVGERGGLKIGVRDRSNESGTGEVGETGYVSQGIRDGLWVGAPRAGGGSASGIAPGIGEIGSGCVVSGVRGGNDVADVVELGARGEPQAVGIAPAFGGGHVSASCIRTVES